MDPQVIWKIGLAASAVAGVMVASARPQVDSKPLQGEAAVAHLKAQRLYTSLSEAFTAARYQVRPAAPPETGYTAQNAAQGLRARFERGGMTLAYASGKVGRRQAAVGRQEPEPESRFPQPLRQTASPHPFGGEVVRSLNARTPARLKAPALNASVRLTAVGRGERLAPTTAADIRTEENRVDYTHRTAAGTQLTEWYVNAPTGLEHGFLLKDEVGGRPHRLGPVARVGTPDEAGPLALELALDTELRPEASADGQRLTLRDEQGEAMLAYEKLKVWDAAGRILPARMQLVTTSTSGPEGSASSLIPHPSSFATASAGRKTPPYTLQLTIDDAEAVYPVTIDPTWTQQQKLVTGDGVAGDSFGTSVAIDGDTAVIGASFDDVGANGNQGSAYVFTRSGGTWTQQAQLVASDGAANDQFGAAVDVDGDTAVVGAGLDDVGANGNQGSAYVFTRSGGTWSQQAQLTADDGTVEDQFALTLAVDGDTVVVGASRNDVGSAGDQGSMYVFVRSGVTWTQQAQLTASDGLSNDRFGIAVALDGETAIAGASEDDVSGRFDQGSAYVFVRSGVTWTQQAQLTASDGLASDYLGTSVAIDGDTAIAGATLDDAGITNQGSAYVFVRSGVTWTQQARLTASDAASNDFLGTAVGISGDTAAVGASFNDVSARAEQGSIYVFTRSGTTWTQQTQLTASDGAADDRLGANLALDGSTVVSGTGGHDTGGNANQGAAYVFAVPPDPPVISNVQVTSVGQASATITWTTDVSASSTVEYRTLGSISYSTATGAAGTSHTVSLSGLTAGRTYEYRVVSLTDGGSAPDSQTTYPAAGNLQFLTAPNLTGEVLGLSLRRLAGTIYATVTYYNASGASQSSVEVVSGELAGTSTVSTTTGLPVSLGTVAAGSAASTTLEFSGGAGVAGSTAVITIGFSSGSGGSSSSSYRVTLP